jgi:7-cyano-7-deazaguanine synthase
MNHSNTLLLHSGGLDSSILGYELAKQGIDFSSVFIDFGQSGKNSELKATKSTSSILGAPLDVIEVPTLRSPFVSSSASTLRVMPNPGRGVLELGSLLLYGIAFTYAHQKGIKDIYVGLTKLDADSSKEYSQGFLDAFSKLVEEAGYASISLQAPFLVKTKGNVVKLGSDNLELIRSTWSCIHDSETHCGMCEGCLSRRKAFEQAGIPDPVL